MLEGLYFFQKTGGQVKFIFNDKMAIYNNVLQGTVNENQYSICNTNVNTQIIKTYQTMTTKNHF